MIDPALVAIAHELADMLRLMVIVLVGGMAILACLLHWGCEGDWDMIWRMIPGPQPMYWEPMPPPPPTPSDYAELVERQRLAAHRRLP